ncbi:MAG: mannosyltransferase family protein [Planctomycetota bacterium]|nr:mannosyltransferase family protein [Planctomycetota bacterium]
MTEGRADPGLAATPEMRARGPKDLILFLLAWKAIFFLIVFASLAILPNLFALEIYQASFHWPRGAPPTVWTHLSAWDGQHYLFLSEVGYNPSQSSNGMFPLWPAAIRIAAPLFAGSHLWSGLFLANAFSIAGMILFYRLARERLGSGRAADGALMFAIAAPGALFFSFIYSESLFFFLAVAMMLALVRGRWWWAVAASFLLPLVRGVGIFAVVPLFYETIRWWRSEGRIPWVRSLGLLAPCLGIGIYFLIMNARLGDPLAGFDVQGKMFVSQRSVGYLFGLFPFLRSLVDFGSFHGFLDSSLDRAFFLIFVASLYPLWRLDRRLFFYALPIGLAPALTSLMAYTRYFMMAFPVFLVLGSVVASRKWWLLRALLIGTALGLQVYLTIRHINFYWAG